MNWEISRFLSRLQYIKHQNEAMAFDASNK